MIKIGVIGYGYWGPNLVRNFAEGENTQVAAVADLDPKKLEIVQKRYPAVRGTTRFQDLLEDPTIDAIAVATPVSTHFELGMAALKAGKHLWLEKPMTETLAPGAQARRRGREAQARAARRSHLHLHRRGAQDGRDHPRAATSAGSTTTTRSASTSGCSSATSA